MTFEFKNIVKSYQKANGLKAVLATLVALKGSSYRKPGVRMLIFEDGNMIGAVSGGCVEKEICRQSVSVFKTGISKIMTYDGRYRLGCEGTLFILIEPFNPSDFLITQFENAINERKSFYLKSFYTKNEEENKLFGSVISFDQKQWFGFSGTIKNEAENSNSLAIFEQLMPPCFRLVIIGAEHDAAQLSLFASQLGWEVIIITSATSQHTILDFPGSTALIQSEPNLLNINWINSQTAIVFMTHSYAKDLQYLLAFKNSNPIYMGLLGPFNRREKLITDLIEQFPEVETAFLDKMYGPAGLNIGAETSQEIAVSICAEILSVTRQQKPDFLKNKTTAIHS
jgi:xanthine/CO dehydrogenase XdhC/CoxF family maturation factor